MTNKPKTIKKELMVERRGKEKKQTNKQTFLKRKGRQEISASNGTKAARNQCTRYNPLSSDNNTAGQKTLINERYNSRNKRASQEKKQ